MAQSLLLEREPQQAPQTRVSTADSLPYAGWLPLALIWEWLASGRIIAIEHTVEEETCTLTVVHRPLDRRTPLNRLQLALIVELLGGTTQKVLAIDRQLSTSSVSTIAAGSLRQLGAIGAARRAPLAFVLIAAAYSSRNDRARAWIARNASRSSWSVRIARPDHSLQPMLSAAQYDIARKMIEGLSHEEIAARRGRSPRTVANQIRSLFEKLDVAQRFQLVSLAFSLAHGVSATGTSEPVSLVELQPRV